MKTARTTIRLLREFVGPEPLLGVTDLARRLDIHKASAHRLLKTLVEERILEQDPESRRYRLGLGILELAAARLAQFGVIEVALPHLERLREQTGETVALLVRDGHEMVCIHVLESPHRMRVSFLLGERAPVHATASGISCLAHLAAPEQRALILQSRAAFRDAPELDEKQLAFTLEQARREECSTMDGTYQSHVRSAAAPVRDAAGAILCVLAVAAPAQRIGVRDLWPRARQVREFARAISHDLGGLSVVRPRAQAGR